MRLVDLEKLLPEDLPAGERVLWLGRPAWFSMARRAFRGDIVAGYFVVLAIWNGASAFSDAGAGGALIAATTTIASGVAALALLGLLAFLSSRTTLYVVTNRRLVMKIGIALPIFLNLPFVEIVSASVGKHRDGTGDIPVTLGPTRRIAYLHLWPHARPFNFSRPQPCLRCIPNAGEAAEILSRALIAAANERSALRSDAAPVAAPNPALLPGIVAA